MIIRGNGFEQGEGEFVDRLTFQFSPPPMERSPNMALRQPLPAGAEPFLFYLKPAKGPLDFPARNQGRMATEKIFKQGRPAAAVSANINELRHGVPLLSIARS